MILSHVGAPHRDVRPMPFQPATPIRRALRGAVVLALLIVFAGCTAIEPPDVTLVNLSITDITVLETSGTVTLRLSNANPEPLQVDGAAFDLYLDGRKVGRALSDQTIEVPRLSTATMEATLSLSHLAVVTRLQSILEAEQLDYRLRGKVWTTGELGRKSLRVERSGTVDLDGIGELAGDLGVDVGSETDAEAETEADETGEGGSSGGPTV